MASEHKSGSTVLVIVLVAALAVGVFFYVSTQGKNDAITDLVNKAIGTAEGVVRKVIPAGTGTALGAALSPHATMSPAQIADNMAKVVAEGNSRGFQVKPILSARPMPGAPVFYYVSNVKLDPGTVNMVSFGKVVQVAPGKNPITGATAPANKSLRVS